MGSEINLYNTQNVLKQLSGDTFNNFEENTETVSELQNRNLIINGDFNIWQRGNSVTNPTYGYKSADRWTTRDTTGIGGTYVISEGVDTGNGEHYMKHVHTSATDYSYMWQGVEGKDAFGKTVTVSCEIYVDNKMDIQLSLRTIENSALTSTTEPSRQSIAAGSWVSIEYTGDIEDIDTTTPSEGHDFLQFVIFFFGDATDAIGTNTIKVKNTQVEYGSYKTPFEKRDKPTELALCQRYYQKFNNVQVSGWFGDTTNEKGYVVSTRFPVIMNHIPSITVTSVGSSGFPTTFIQIIAGKNFVMFTRLANATQARGYFLQSFTADAELL